MSSVPSLSELLNLSLPYPKLVRMCVHKLIPLYHHSRRTLQSILNGKTSEVCYYYRSVSSAVCSMYNVYLIGILCKQNVYIYVCL